MFLDIRLPEDISYNAVGGPEFSTNIVVLKNSSEERNVNWERPRYNYSIGYDRLNKEKAEKLLAFFYMVRGRGYSFRLKDWFDYQAKDQKLISTITSSSYQLIKKYKIGDISYDRVITKPTKGTLIIKNGAVILVEGKDYTANYQNGIVKILPSTGTDVTKLTTNFEFDVPVRFDSDTLDLVNDSFRLYSWKSVKLIETRE